jgi:hypothetical protein
MINGREGMYHLVLGHRDLPLFSCVEGQFPNDTFEHYIFNEMIISAMIPMIIQ